MNLTRRDVVAALSAAGVAVGGGAVVLSMDDSEEGTGENDSGGPLADKDYTTLVAAAEVLYPSELEGIEEFVTSYVQRRAEDSKEYAEGLGETVGYLNEYSQAWYDQPFAELDPADREEVFRESGAVTADPAPDGSDVERLRYSVINELLFALYSTPTGAELVGLENPQGYPGGIESYQRGSES